MRLFLLVLFVVGTPALILLLTRLSYVLVPWSVSDFAKRVLVHSCAYVMAGAEWSYFVVARALPRNAPWGLWRIREGLIDLAYMVSPRANHATARVLGRVCVPCEVAAPGWWDFYFDCGDHLCGECETCVSKRRASR